jgi:hypothetical protein
MIEGYLQSTQEKEPSQYISLLLKLGCPTEADLISGLYNCELLTFNKPKLSLMSSS